MSNRLDDIAIHLEGDAYFDRAASSVIKRIVIDKAQEIRHSGRIVLRKTLAAELEIDPNRLTRIIRKFDLSYIFD